MQIIYTLLALGLALFLGRLFQRLKVPGAMLVATVILVAAFQVLSQQIYVPAGIKDISQIIAGAFVGASLIWEDIRRLPALWRGFIILIVGLIGLNLLAALLIHRFSALDWQTAVFASIPGGMSTIPIISADYGANPISVTALQFVRLVMGIGVFPSLVDRLSLRLAGEDATSQPSLDNKPKNSVPIKEDRPTSMPRWLSLVLVAGLATLFSQLIPSISLMVWSIIFMAICKLFLGGQSLPAWLRKIAQVLSGWYIGAQFGLEELLNLQALLLPAIINILVYLLGCITIGYLIHRFQKLPLTDSMLAAIPAGASDMVLIAGDLNIHNADIIVYQVLRLIIVTSIFPDLMYGLVGFIVNR